jgi:hypothetical protein
MGLIFTSYSQCIWHSAITFQPQYMGCSIFSKTQQYQLLASLVKGIFKKSLKVGFLPPVD